MSRFQSDVFFRRMFQRADVDRDGGVNDQDFADYFIDGQFPAPLLGRLFASINTSGSGLISLLELKAFFRRGKYELFRDAVVGSENMAFHTDKLLKAVLDKYDVATPEGQLVARILIKEIRTQLLESVKSLSVALAGPLSKGKGTIPWATRVDASSGSPRPAPAVTPIGDGGGRRFSRDSAESPMDIRVERRASETPAAAVGSLHGKLDSMAAELSSLRREVAELRAGGAAGPPGGGHSAIPEGVPIAGALPVPMAGPVGAGSRERSTVVESESVDTFEGASAPMMSPQLGVGSPRGTMRPAGFAKKKRTFAKDRPQARQLLSIIASLAATGEIGQHQAELLKVRVLLNKAPRRLLDIVRHFESIQALGDEDTTQLQRRQVLAVVRRGLLD